MTWFKKLLALTLFLVIPGCIMASDNPLDRHLPSATPKVDSHDAHGGDAHAPVLGPAKPDHAHASPTNGTSTKAKGKAGAAPQGGGHGGGALTPEAAKETAEAALIKLRDGNEHVVTSEQGFPRQKKDRRVEVAKGQKPFAIILGCSDSRVPPEMIFDQGLGDLFVVRVAGNVIDDPAIGSIEYAVDHLGVTLIVVLGHERCGAVDAACKRMDAPGHIGSLVKAITPAVDAVRGKPGDLLANAVNANVLRVTDQLKASWPLLAPWVRSGRVTVVGAVYDLDTGLVTFLN